jgi:hypothetical protein
LAVKGNDSVRGKLESASKDDEAFYKFLFEHCPQLKVMQDIATSSKHVKMEEKHSVLDSTHVHHGSMNEGEFNRNEFDVSRLMVTDLNGAESCFEVALDAVVKFWGRFFKKYLSDDQNS